MGGCNLCFFQIRWTVAGLTCWLAAMDRTLQCVTSFGVVFIVASTMAVSLSAEICFGSTAASFKRPYRNCPGTRYNPTLGLSQPGRFR